MLPVSLAETLCPSEPGGFVQIESSLLGSGKRHPYLPIFTFPFSGSYFHSQLDKGLLHIHCQFDTFFNMEFPLLPDILHYFV